MRIIFALIPRNNESPAWTLTFPDLTVLGYFLTTGSGFFSFKSDAIELMCRVNFSIKTADWVAHSVGVFTTEATPLPRRLYSAKRG